MDWPSAFAHTFDSDAVEDLLEEASDDHAHRFFASESARTRVENQLFIHFARRAAVRATHIVSQDLEARNRIGARLIAEQQVVVALINRQSF